MGGWANLMKHTLRTLVVMAAAFAVLLVPVAANAWDPFSGADCSGASGASAVCTDKSSNTNPLYGTNSTILKVTDFMATIAGIAAVIMLLVGGIKYTLAGGESKDIAEAKRTIIYALVGIAVIVSATAIITFIVSRLQ